jgi:Peptidase family M1 domain
MRKPRPKSVAILALLLLLATRLLGGDTPNGYWQQFVHYKMNVSLDPATKFLTGTSSILYRNNSPNTLDKIYLYLYPNAFRNNKTIYAKEAAQFYERTLPNDEAAGWIDISEFRILSKGESDSAKAAVIAFKVTDTILEATLPEPLKPGEEIRIELSFKEKVKQFQDRSGYRGNQFDFAQWYPKLCVYDDEGWHPEPFHNVGEFYGEFGTFEVTIDVPFDYIVGATGVVTEGDPGWSLVQVDTSLSATAWPGKYAEMKKAIVEKMKDQPRRQVTFHAEQVHDFAWLTCPDFLYERGEYDGIPIHVLFRSYAKPKWSKVATERGHRALEWLSTKFGRYPYPQLSITHGLLGGGMEYPMLVMDASESEGLILHEVGHIYFYGIFGNNEQKEAFLDEGFTSFQTSWYMETRYGKWGYDRATAMKNATWLQRHRPRVTNNVGNRNFAQWYMNSGYNEPISRYAYKYKDELGYSVNAYTKGSIFYEMLRYVVGEETFQKICHEYFNRWALKHVNEARFKQVCEDVSGMDLGWFFQQWLHETKTVDYQLGSVEKKQTANGKLQTIVEIKRNDEGIMPVEVELTLADNEQIRQRWDGKEKQGTLTFTTATEPRHVVLDPDDQIMDKSRIGHGNLRVEFYPEYPRMNYNPPDAYVVTWKPSFWYNDIDGLRFGARFNGRYRNSRLLSLAGWYGPNSSELDGRFSFSNPLGSHTNYQISLMKLEGRIMGDLSLRAAWAKSLIVPPNFNLTVGVNYTELPKDKVDYTLRRVDIGNNIIAVPTWNVGKVNQTYLTFNVNPRGMKWRSLLNYEIRHADDTFGSDATFTRVQGSFNFSIPSQRGDGLYLRLFHGAFLQKQDDKPIEYLFYAFDANPVEQFDSFYLRSRGAFPAEAHYHRPGGGNLRGYFDQPERAGKSLLAANAELRKSLRLPLISKLLAPVLGNSTLSAFFDTGRLEDLNDVSKQLSDAGLGITFNKQWPDDWYTFIIGTNYTLRLDFPLWVSEPRVKPDGSREDEFKFRYVLSFQRVL